MKTKRLRIEKFLDEMDRVVPWDGLIGQIRPYYKTEGGRPPHDLGLMPRICFGFIFYNFGII